MAAANLNTNKVSLKNNTVNTGFTFTAFDGTDGAEYTVGASDTKTVLLIQNTDSSNAENVTIKSPTNPALGVGTAHPDKVVSVAADGLAIVQIESTKFMDANGKVKLTGSADVKAVLLEME